MSRLPLIIGHRGASALAPENTIAAFRQAINDGADGIEFDVRLSRDGAAVVIHDANLERTGSSARQVAELTEAGLKATDVGSWFERPPSRRDREFRGETVPSLQQVFDLFSGNTGILYLEMKADGASGNELVKEVVRMIRHASIEARVIVECFDLSLIQKVKTADPAIRTAALFEPRLSRPSSLLRRNLPELAQAHGADEIAFHHRLASRRVIEQSLKLGLRVVVWTVDDPEWVRKAQTLDVTALITNDPGRLVKRRDSAEV